MFRKKILVSLFSLFLLNPVFSWSHDANYGLSLSHDANYGLSLSHNANFRLSLSQNANYGLYLSHNANYGISLSHNANYGLNASEPDLLTARDGNCGYLADSQGIKDLKGDLGVQEGSANLTSTNQSSEEWDSVEGSSNKEISVEGTSAKQAAKQLIAENLTSAKEISEQESSDKEISVEGSSAKQGSEGGISVQEGSAQQTNLIQKKDKIRNMQNKDPYGLILSLVAIAVVFIALGLLYLLFSFLFANDKNIFERLWAKIKSKNSENIALNSASASATNGDFSDSFENNSSNERALGSDSSEVEDEVAIAICMALEDYRQNEVHDQESFILCINEQAYSNWNNKILMFRQKPQKNK